MRVLTMSEIDAYLTIMGAREYDPRPVTTEYRGRVAIHAGAEPTSWASVVRRARGDAVFAACLREYGLDSRKGLKRLSRGAIIGVAELLEVIPAAQYLPPPCTGEVRGCPWLWRLSVMRACRPVVIGRGRSNLWAPLDDVKRAVEGAKTVPVDLNRIPYLAGRAAVRRSPGEAENWRRLMAGYERELAWNADYYGEGGDCEPDDDEIEAMDEHNWDDPVVRTEGPEAVLLRGRVQYFREHEVRERNGVVEVKLDRRNPVLARAFPGTRWVSRKEFAAGLRLHYTKRQARVERQESVEAKRLLRRLKSLRAEVRGIENRLGELGLRRSSACADNTGRGDALSRSIPPSPE